MHTFDPCFDPCRVQWLVQWLVHSLAVLRFVQFLVDHFFLILLPFLSLLPSLFLPVVVALNSLICYHVEVQQFW